MQIFLRVRQFLVGAFVLAATNLVAGCAGSGPTLRALVDGGSASGGSKYLVIEIDDHNVDRISSWHRPSLMSLYGDYRIPKVQRIDVGDTVQVTIWEASSGAVFAPASLSERGGGTTAGARPSTIPEQVVARDGTVQIPYAGRIKVAGKTPQEVEESIVKRLIGKSNEPQALVNLSRNISHSATVSGDVTTGARIPLSSRGDRVLDVIAGAGGIKAPVHESFISISRDGQTLTVPMQTILSNPKENVYIRPGDVVTVVRSPQSFTAVGATGRQALVPFDAGGLTLEEALGKSGGLNDDRSDPEGVFVMRFEQTQLVSKLRGATPQMLNNSTVPVAYRLNLKDPASLFKARRFAMRDKDILYVSHAPITEVEKVFRSIGLLTAPAAAVAAGRAAAN